MPTRTAYSTAVPSELFGQDSTQGQICNIHLDSSTDAQLVTLAPYMANQQIISSPKRDDTAITINATDTLKGICSYGTNYITTTDVTGIGNSVITLDNSTGNIWSVTPFGTNNIVAVCTDASTYFWVYNQTEDKLYKLLLTDGSQVSSVTVGFTNELTYWDGAFLYKGNVYVISYGRLASGAYTTRLEIAKIDGYAMTTTSVTTLCTDSHDQSYDPQTDESDTYFMRSYIMPYDDGIVYQGMKVGDVWNFYELVNLNAL